MTEQQIAIEMPEAVTDLTKETYAKAMASSLTSDELFDVLEVAIARAYAMGKAESGQEYQLTLDTIQAIADGRQDKTVETVVLAVMETCGKDRLQLNLDRMATVWSRNRLAMRLVKSDDGRAFVTYNRTTIGGRE